MPSAPKTIVRTTVSLPPELARKVNTLAKKRTVSANRVLVELIEDGFKARDRERATFLELAERLSRSTDSDEQQSLKEELARMTFGS
jgi:metal-responsive CopG/Arc/MetJ family transcriptional regulator